MRKKILLLLVACYITIGNAFGQMLSDVTENLGTFSSPFSLKWGLNPLNDTESYAHYHFTLTTPLDIIISHCESTLEGQTGIFLSDRNGDIIISNTGSDECMDRHAHAVAACLLPGNYQLDIDWSPGTKGSVYTLLQGLVPNVIRSNKNIGDYNRHFSYTDTKDTSNPDIGYRGDNVYQHSVCYGFYLSCNMDITVSHCGSEMNKTNVFLLNENGNDISHTVGIKIEETCDNLGQAYLKRLNIPPGMYYVVSKGAAGTGKITTRIIGTKTIEVLPITKFAQKVEDIGTYDRLFVFENMKDTSDPAVGYQGYDDYRSGVCYSFRLPREMDVEISHCGSKMKDTEVYLLDKNGNRLAYNNDYSGVNACDTYLYAHLEVPKLAAGDYYVVSVGKFEEKGKIDTKIICKEPERSVGSTDKNYILTRTFRDSFGGSWQDKVNYFDEMGRIEETSLVNASPLENNIVSLTEYDAFGRVEKAWLQAETGFTGEYISPEHLKKQISNSNCNDSAPYLLTNYEQSPLNRPICEYGSGQDWQTKGKGVRTKYQLTNVAGNDSLNCICYQLRSETENTDTIVSISPVGNYPSGSLDVVHKTDEDGNAVIEFKNRFGQTVLNRQIVKGAYREHYDTNYIYDEWGNLHVVLPPRASDYIKASGSHWTNAFSFTLRDYAYLYKYDKRFRMTAKKLPGQDWIRYVYDKANHPVFTQDGEQRKRGEWSFSITDGQGRVSLTGICKNSIELSQSSLDTVVNAVRNDSTGECKGYSVSGIILVDAKVMAVNYYDDYNFMQTKGFPALNASDYEYEVTGSYGERYKGGSQSMLTGTLTAQLDENMNSTELAYIPAVMYYDYRGRMIQRKSGSYLMGGTEKEYMTYDFTGSPLKYKHVHSATGKPTYIEEYAYSYDHTGRLMLTKFSLNGGAPIVLTDKIYDHLGRLSDFCRHGNYNKLETWFDYNVRSWITAINGPLFSQKLYYNDQRSNVTNNVCYNGNISGMDWKAASDNTLRSYDFTYDGQSRLIQADYLESGNRKKDCFDTSYRYDKHGNFTNLKRYGQTGLNTCGLIDNLQIGLNGNQLESVKDIATSSVYANGFEFKDGSGEEIEYFYDANGNLTKDLNKNIANIQYNFLNLPRCLTFGDGSRISYIYDAAGKKLRTTYNMDGVSTVTDYCDNVIYENGVAKTLLFEGGYLSLDNGKYHYFIQDHQGNNRVVVDQNGTIEEVNHYYPFGGTFENTSSFQPYKYNGKELETKKELDWYDYGARQYDAEIGRWHGTDPMSEKYYGVSPYVYCNNNPVKYIDPDGRDWRIKTCYDSETQKIEYQMSVNAVLYNNSSNKDIDMTKLASSITQQINDVYSTSGNGFVSKMDFNMKVVNSVDEIGASDHVFRVVDQGKLDDTYSSIAPGKVAADANNSGLDIRISANSTGDIINGSDTRTAAHELGHTGGLHDLPKVMADKGRLMMQAVNVQNLGGIPNNALRLPHSDIKTIRDNYINNSLNQNSPVKTWYGRKIIRR